MENAYFYLYIAALCFIGIGIFISLLRTIFVKTLADRIISVNMTGTLVIGGIAVLSLMLGEDWLADICIIYALISFIAVIALTKVYIGVKNEERNHGKDSRT